MHKHEEKFPGSIGFINDDVEIFVVRESLFSQLFCPHFHLYNHETQEIQSFRFNQLVNCSLEVRSFLGTTRAYSQDKEKYLLPRTYYVDLVTEWEIVMKSLQNAKMQNGARSRLRSISSNINPTPSMLAPLLMLWVFSPLKAV